MSSPAGVTNQPTSDSAGHVPSAENLEIHVGRLEGGSDGSGGFMDQLDLLQRAAAMMATGAITEEQAKTLSRQIRECTG